MKPGCITFLGLMFTMPAFGAERGFYTENKMNALKTNLEAHDWAPATGSAAIPPHATCQSPTDWTFKIEVYNQR